jgi:hypothetical protein
MRKRRKIPPSLDLKHLNWPTVILILVTGGVNWFATTQNSQQRGYELQRALSEIHDIPGLMDEFKRKQQENVERG